MAQGSMNEKMLNVRMPESEFLLLTRYAAATGRTKTDVVRELIRGLEQKLPRKAQRQTKSAGMK
jgi:predicted DNA-binding protein